MNSTHQIRIGGLTLAFGLLAGCVVEEGPGPGPGRPLPPERPQFCTREYSPVCAVRRGDRQTFPNACEADRAGYRIIADGPCRSDWADRPPEGPRMCTMQYDPVCARRGGDERTFGNSCEAANAGYRVVAEGECE